MAGLRSSHLSLLSTILLLVTIGSSVVNGQSTGEFSCIYITIAVISTKVGIGYNNIICPILQECSCLSME